MTVDDKAFGGETLVKQLGTADSLKTFVNFPGPLFFLVYFNL